jgi:hypothetical protein
MNNEIREIEQINKIESLKSYLINLSDEYLFNMEDYNLRDRLRLTKDFMWNLLQCDLCSSNLTDNERMSYFSFLIFLNIDMEDEDVDLDFGEDENIYFFPEED